VLKESFGFRKLYNKVLSVSLADTILRRDLVECFARTGWAAVPGFFNAAETTRLRQYVRELGELPERSGARMLYHENSLLEPNLRVLQRVEDFCPYHAGLDALIRAGRLAGAVEELLGEEAVLFKDKINYKASGGGAFEPHQDQQAGWSRYAPLFITALVSIDRATEENGCLEIANTPRLSRLIGKEWQPLTPEELSGLEFESLPTEPGDVVFFDSFVVHRSQANLTPHGRRVLYVTYNRAADGDHRQQYYADKRASFPPDIDRQPGVTYQYRV
jgi:2-aminoethylphosphonate dioxygenase